MARKKNTARRADHPRSILAFLEARLKKLLETHLETCLETRVEKLFETCLVRAVLLGCKDGHPNFLSIILALPDPLDGHPSGALQAYLQWRPAGPHTTVRQAIKKTPNVVQGLSFLFFGSRVAKFHIFKSRKSKTYFLNGAPEGRGAP